MTEQKKKKKKSIRQKLASKFSQIKKKPEDENLLAETISELKSVVRDMKEIFEEIDKTFEEETEKEKTFWDKLKSKMPQRLQPQDIRKEKQQKQKIRSNKERLEKLEDALSQFEAISTMPGKEDMLAEEYLKLLKQDMGSKFKDEDLEKVIDEMKLEIYRSMEDINAQIRLLKTALETITEQLTEQGIQLERIEEKVDVVDKKLDKAQELIKKVARRLTGNNVLILVLAGSVLSLLALSIIR